MGGVGVKPFVELSKPLGVDERPQDAPHLVGLVAAFQGPEKAKFDHLGDVAAHAVVQLGLVGGIWQEQPHHIKDFGASNHKTRVAALGVEFGELLAQQRQQQAYRVAQLPPDDEPGQLRLALDRRTLAQIGVAFGLVQDQIEPDDCDVVAHPRLMADERLPQLGSGVALHHAFHQGDEHDGQFVGRGFAHRVCSSVLSHAEPSHAEPPWLAARVKRMWGMTACRVRPAPSVHDHRQAAFVVDDRRRVLRGEAEIGHQLGEPVFERMRLDDLGERRLGAPL